MRKTPKLPRILKIEAVRGLQLLVMFNNGESRLLTFEDIFKQWRMKTSSPEHALLKPLAFRKVTLRNGTLSWPNVAVRLPDEQGNLMAYPYEIDPSVLYTLSSPADAASLAGLGSLIKKERMRAGLSQDELAQRSGTTRFYISRVENNKTDLELATLRKIVEAGLGKKIRLTIE